SPLLQHALLQRETGLHAYVKDEQHNPTGPCKGRGGPDPIGRPPAAGLRRAPNLIGSLPAAERRGVITATTGNHGQSIPLACRLHGVPCTIVTPVGNNPEKNAAMLALGAAVIELGRDFDEARERVEAMQHERGLRYVHS